MAVLSIKHRPFPWWWKFHNARPLWIDPVSHKQRRLDCLLAAATGNNLHIFLWHHADSISIWLWFHQAMFCSLKSDTPHIIYMGFSAVRKLNLASGWHHAYSISIWLYIGNVAPFFENDLQHLLFVRLLCINQKP